MLARADALARKPRMVCVAIEETWNGLGKGKGKKARSGWPGLRGTGRWRFKHGLEVEEDGHRPRLARGLGMG